MKRIRIVTVILLIAVLMTSCQVGKHTDGASGAPCEVSFEACLYADKKLLQREDVITVEQDEWKATLHVENPGTEFSVGMMLFSNGLPIQYTVDHIRYSYYVFTADDKTDVDFSVTSYDLPQGESQLSVVLLLDDMYMYHNRDDEKNYSMAMSYGLCNTSDSFSEEPAIDQIEGTVIPYDRLYQACLARVSATSIDYTYEYEKEALYHMVSDQDVDLCFSKSFDLQESCNLSVLRNTVYNVNSESEDAQKVTVRMCGKAGEYYLTMFCDGRAYAAFDGQTTAKVVLTEDAYTFIEITLPPYADSAQAVVNGLLFDCDPESGGALYDSGLLQVYYAGSDIDLSYNQYQSTMNLYYQNELIITSDEQVFDYTGDAVCAEFTFCEYSTSYNHSYSLMVFADGLLQAFSVDDGQTYGYSYDIPSPYEITDINVTLTPVLPAACSDFELQFMVVPKTVSSSIAPPSKGDLSQCLTGTIQFAVSDPSGLQVLPEATLLHGGEEDSDPFSGLSTEMRIDDAYNAYATNTILSERKGLGDVRLTFSAESTDGAISCLSAIMVNGSLLTVDGSDFFSWSSGEAGFETSVAIPEEKLSYGMNEIYLFSYTEGHVRMDRLNLLIYDDTVAPFAYAIREEDGLIEITTPETTDGGQCKVFCSTIEGSVGRFGNFYQCVTGRFLYVSSEQTTRTIGDREYDARMAVTTIITKYDYCDGVYTFARVKSTGRLV